MDLCSVLVEAAWSAFRTRTYLGARFRRLHRRFGKNGANKAAVALAHNILVIVWHVLTTNTSYVDLGADYYLRRDDPQTRKNRRLHQLQDLGYTVELALTA